MVKNPNQNPNKKQLHKTSTKNNHKRPPNNKH